MIARIIWVINNFLKYSISNFLIIEGVKVHAFNLEVTTAVVGLRPKIDYLKYSRIAVSKVSQILQKTHGTLAPYTIKYYDLVDKLHILHKAKRAENTAKNIIFVCKHVFLYNYIFKAILTKLLKLFHPNIWSMVRTLLLVPYGPICVSSLM